MSYIRSTSNPEGLYVYSDGEFVNIHIDPAFARGPDVKHGLRIPQEVFDTACKKWHKTWSDTEHEGFSIEEVHVFEDDLTPVPEGFLNQDMLRESKERFEYYGERIPGFMEADWAQKADMICDFVETNPEQEYRSDMRGTRFAQKLSWQGNELFLWQVTWRYMTSRFSD